MQHDFNIANQGFPATRSDINNALAALASTSSGTSEPSTTYANQFWYDTTNNLLKFRNEADSAWITLAYLDQGTNEWEIRSAVIQAVDSAGVVIKTDDGTTRVTVADDGDVTFANDVTVNGNLDVSSGTIKLDGNYPVGTRNVALGDEALNGSITGARNTALGAYAAGSITSGNDNTAVGDTALYLNTTGSDNVAVGRTSLDANTTGSYNTAIGRDALTANTTASNNTAVGYQAGYSKTTGDPITAVGYQALTSVTTGAYSTAVGRNAGDSVTTGNHNTLMGNFTGADITTGASNTALGSEALRSNTTASKNTAFGYQAGYSTTTGQYNLFVGSFAGYSSTGTGNTFVGAQTAGYGCGDQITTGSKNTILGAYNGNEGGLDIRTSSNNIVLSDGDGNPRGYFDNVGALHIDKTAFGGGTGIYLNNTNNQNWIAMRFNTGGSLVGYISTTTTATSYITSSDYRLKENVVELTGATDRLKQLNPSRFNFIADADTTVDGFLAHEVQAVVPEAITGSKDEVDVDGNPVYQGIDQSKLVPLLVATIKELEARITTLEAN